MTQEQLGAKIGLSRASVVNIEHGRQQVLLHHVVAMSAATETALLDLLQPLEPSPPIQRKALRAKMDASLADVVEKLLRGEGK